jgi:hypothetical protein
MRWSIFYADGSVVHGSSAQEWHRAPARRVQVVVAWVRPTVLRWREVQDRELWTGEDVYDPFGWGPKYGSWMLNADYFRLWERAAYGPDDARRR